MLLKETANSDTTIVNGIIHEYTLTTNTLETVLY